MFLLRKIAGGLIVIAISSAIFFLLVSDKTTKKDILRPTLEALGEQLFNAVQSDSSKEDLEKNYSDFVKKAEAKEINPKEVEKIAAEILNLTSHDSLISSKDAMHILTLKPEVIVTIPEYKEFPTETYAGKADISYDERKILKFEKEMSQEELAERLKAMYELQNKLILIAKESKKSKSSPRAFAYFKSDSGLRVQIDMDLKKLLEEQDLLLEKDFRDLEKKKWLQWHHEIDLVKKRAMVIEDSLRQLDKNKVSLKEDEYLIKQPKSERHSRKPEKPIN